MKLFASLLLLTLVTVALAGKSSTVSSEDTAARIPLEDYFKAHATGNPEFVRKAFLPEARVMAYRDGKLLNLSAEEFAARFNGKPAADEAQRQRRIETLDISGNSAIAKLVLDYPEVRFTDYMSLLKINGEWKIASKVFYAEPKRK
jgi:regulator of protease activity HflC (stomatin/prohibitin superfamily)